MVMNMTDNEQKPNSNTKKYRTPDGVPADIVMFTLTKRERKTVTKTLPIRELKVMEAADCYDDRRTRFRSCDWLYFVGAE